MSKKKNLSNKFSYIFISFFIFFVALIILLTVPTVVTLSQSKIVKASNIIDDKPEMLIGEVAGESRKSVIEVTDSGIAPPQFSALGVYAFDLDNGKELFAKNPHLRLPPASTTKIITALVALDHYKAAEIIRVPSTALVGGSSMNLNAGENMSFRALLYGMMLNSGNDAAFTLAINYPGGLSVFMDKMNEKAKSLGLENTHFENPAGFDGVTHYSSAYDLAQIAIESTKNTTLSKIVSTKETSVISMDKTTQHSLQNLNKLLDQDGVIGIKTGYTEKAGENLVGLVDRNGHRILTVVLNSSDRFGETKALMNWVFENYKWEVKN